MSVKLLMIAFHFPPVASSSGFLRALKFAKYLPEFGIYPSVLTVKPSAYENINKANNILLEELPDIEIIRSAASDAATDFAIKGKYPGFLAFPDRWSSWIPFGICSGLFHIKQKKIDVIWATYPIISALVIGYWLKKITGLPLICDLRDPIWEEETWEDTRKQRWLKSFEFKLLKLADKIIFTSPGTIKKYQKRYPNIIDTKSILITNGYDSDNFKDVNKAQDYKKIFLHSGVIPIYERNPENFFLALSYLKKQGVICGNEHEFRLRACGFSSEYQKRTKELQIDDLVSFPESISYEEALQEMQSADALMILQDKTCNWQIPAKVFEYMHAQRPILGWVDQGSDTADVLSSCNMGEYIAPLSDAMAIADALSRFIREDAWQIKCQGYEHFERKMLASHLAVIVADLACSNQADITV